MPAFRALCYSPAESPPGVRDRSWLCGIILIHVRRGRTISRDLRINQMIRVPQVRVIDEDGGQLGVMPTFEALRLAQERGFDLVVVETPGIGQGDAAVAAEVDAEVLKHSGGGRMVEHDLCRR